MTTNELLIDALRSIGDDAAPVGVADAHAFTAAVLERVAVLPAPGSLRRRRLLRRVAAAVAVVTLAVAPGPRTALARWLGIGSVRVERGSTDGASLPLNVLALDLGSRSSVSAASRLIGHPISVQRGRSPVGVWTQAVDGGAVMVNTVYVDDAPASVVLVSELPGAGDVYISSKLLGPGSHFEAITVHDRPAAWITGDPHQVAVLDRRGEVIVTSVRLAGNVLLWADDQHTLRIEGIDDRDDALATLERLLEP